MLCVGYIRVIGMGGYSRTSIIQMIQYTVPRFFMSIPYRRNLWRKSKIRKKRVGLNRKHNKYMGLIILAIVLYVIGFFIGFGPFWPVQMILGAAGWFGVIIAGAWWLLLISGIA